MALITVTLGFHYCRNFIGETATQVISAKQLLSVSTSEAFASVLGKHSSLILVFLPPLFVLSFFLKDFLRTYYVQVTESAVRDTNTNKINATATTTHSFFLWQRKLRHTNICPFPPAVSSARQYLYSPCSFFGQMTGFWLVQL